MSATKICVPLKDCTGMEEGSSNVWHLAGRMGDPGAFGEIWTACCRTDCKYVLKYQKYGKDVSASGEYSGSVFPEDVKREVTIQKRLADLDLAPKVVDSWDCQTGGTIVMMALKETVNSLMYRYTSSWVREEIIRECIDLIEKVHAAGIYHGDIHLKNIMVDYDPVNKDKLYGKSLSQEEHFKRMKYRFYFIDFGLAGKLDKSRIIADYNSAIVRFVEIMGEDHVLMEKIRAQIDPKIKKYGLKMK